MNEAPTAPFVEAQSEILGEDHSYPMIAYGTMKKSASWKLYAKSQNVPFELANAVSDQIKRYETAVKHADDDEKDDVDIHKYISDQYYPIYEKSKDYWGLVVSWSIAPCSSLIYNGSIRKEIGLVRVNDNICCLMDGHFAEEKHFLKNDHLKVSVVDLIYNAYQNIGMEPPPVKKLIEMCPPDDPAWTIFERGCTLGINQVEKEGTCARVMKYKPKNISELSAFVAAIRPGGASFYKKFEAREPFSYGVKAFDDLIQTKEFPYSFLMYQEQIMRALNYAGIDMADCYTAIKNIAKKRVEKVLAYHDTFVKGFAASIIRDEGKTEEEATELANGLWKVIEDSASYSFNASHSYCVALDSLYGAWIKAHHPLEFYETYIRIQEDKGDKDKMLAAKEEAESYFGIRFLPMKFGQDNRKMHADKVNNALVNTLGSIKGYGVTVARVLYAAGQMGFDHFIDVLSYLDKNGIKEAKFRPLILIDYFSAFGNQKQLVDIATIWDLFKQGTALTVRRDNPLVTNIRPIIERHATWKKKNGDDAVSYTLKQDEIFDCMRECEDMIRAADVQDLDFRTKIANNLEILGYVDIATGKEVDRRRLLITDIIPLKSKGSDSQEPWAYRLSTKSLGSGKTARISIYTSKYKENPINKGDIVYANSLWKNNQGYWYITEYNIE